MQRLLERISNQLDEMHRTRGIGEITALSYSNGHPNSHIKLRGEVGSFYHRQIVERAVMDLLPASVELLSEIKVS